MKKPEHSYEIAFKNKKELALPHIAAMQRAIEQNDHDQVSLIIEHCGMGIGELLVFAVHDDNVEVATYLYVECEANIELSKSIFVGKNELIARLRVHAEAILIKLKMFLEDFDIDISFTPLKDSLTYMVRLFSANFPNLQLLGYYLGDECHINNLTVEYETQSYSLLLTARNMHILNREASLSPGISAKLQRFKENMTEFMAKFLKDAAEAQVSVTTRQINLKFKLVTHRKILQYCNFLVFRFSDCLDLVGTSAKTEYMFTIRSKNKDLPLYDDPEVAKLLLFDQMEVVLNKIDAHPSEKGLIEWQNEYPALPPKVVSVQPKTVSSEISELLNCKTLLISCLQNITRREKWLGVVAQENTLKLIWRSNDIRDLIRVAAYLHYLASSIIDCKNKRVECHVGNLAQAEGLLCLLKLQAPMSDDFTVPSELYPLYLQKAIEQNDAEQVEFFIEQCGISLENPLPNGKSPLGTAFGFLNAYQYLRHKGARVELTTKRIFIMLDWIYKSISVPYQVRKIHFLDLLADIKTQIPQDQWSSIHFALQGDLASLNALYEADQDALKESVPQLLFMREIIVNSDEDCHIDELHKFYLDHKIDPILDEFVIKLFIQFKREKLLRRCIDEKLFNILAASDKIFFTKSINIKNAEISWEPETQIILSSGKTLTLYIRCETRDFFHFLVESFKLSTVPVSRNPPDISNLMIPCLAAYFFKDLELLKALHENGYKMNHFALENGVPQHCPMHIAVQRNHVEVAKYLFMNSEAEIPFTREMFNKRDKIAAILREYTVDTIRKLTLFLDKFKIGVGMESDFPTLRVQILKYESSLFQFIVQYLAEECKIENLKKHPDRDEYIFPLDAHNIHILNRPDTLSKNVINRFQIMQNAVTRLKVNFFHPQIIQEPFTTEITTREISFKFKSQSAPEKLQEFFTFIAFRFSLNVLIDMLPDTDEYVISIRSKNDKIALYDDPELMKLSVSATLSLAARRISKCQSSELPLDWSIVYPVIQKSIAKSLFENVNLYSDQDIDNVLSAGDLEMNGDLFIYALSHFNSQKHVAVMRRFFQSFTDGKFQLTDGLMTEDVSAFFGDPGSLLNIENKFTRLYFYSLGKHYWCNFHPNALHSAETFQKEIMAALSRVSENVNSDLDILGTYCPKFGDTTLHSLASIIGMNKQLISQKSKKNKKKIANPADEKYADEINMLHCFTKHLDGNVIYRFDIADEKPIVFAPITSAITRGLLRDYFISLEIPAVLVKNRLYLEPKYIRSCEANVLSEASGKQLHDYSQLLNNFSWLLKPLLKVMTWEVQEKSYMLLLKASANNAIQLENIPILLQYFWRRCGFEVDPKLIEVVKSEDQIQLCITYNSLKNPALAALSKNKDDPSSTLLWQLRRITNDLATHAKPLLNMDDLIKVITTAEDARQEKAAKSAVKDDQTKPKAVYAKPPKDKSSSTNKNRFTKPKPPKPQAVQSTKPKETRAVTHFPPQSEQRRLDPSILPVAPSVTKLHAVVMHDFPAPIQVNSNNTSSDNPPSVLPLAKLNQDAPALLPLEEQLIRMQRLISSRHTDCELPIPLLAAFLSAWHFLHGQICNLLRSLDYKHYAKSLIFADEVYHGEKQYNRQKHHYFPPCLLNASSDILKICFQDLASMRATLSCIVGGTDPERQAQRLTRNIIVGWSKYVESEYTREDCNLSKILSSFKTPVDFGEWLLKKIRSYTQHIEFLLKEFKACKDKEESDAWYYAMCFWVGRVGELAGHIPYDRRDKYLTFCRGFRNPTSHTFEPKDVNNDLFIEEPTLDVVKLEKCLPNLEKANAFWSKTIPLTQWQFFVSMRYVYTADDICSLTRLRLEQSNIRAEVCNPIIVTANTNLYAMVHATFKLLQDNKALDKGILLIPAAFENEDGNKNPFAMALIFQRDNEGIMRLVELSYSYVTQNHYQIPDCILALQEKWLETAGQKMTPSKPKLLAMKEIELNDVANHGVLQVELLTRLAQHHNNSGAVSGFSKGKMWLAGLREDHINIWWQNGMQERYLNQLLKNSSIAASVRAMDLSSKSIN